MESLGLYIDGSVDISLDLQIDGSVDRWIDKSPDL